MITRKSSMDTEVIYSADGTHRYLLKTPRLSFSLLIFDFA